MDICIYGGDRRMLFAARRLQRAGLPVYAVGFEKAVLPKGVRAISLTGPFHGVLLTGGDLVELGKRDTWQRHERGPFLKPWLFSPFTPDTPIGYKDVRLFPAVSLHLHEVADGQITRRIAAGRNVGLEAGDKVAPGSGGLGEAG